MLQDYYSNFCNSFCEDHTTFWYGKESPITNSYCHGPFTCTITDTTTTTIGTSGTYKVDWELALKMGITGGFTYSAATAHARAFAVKLEQNQCGYFTVVPVFRTTCGTMTIGFENNDPNTFECAKQTNIGNQCFSQQKLNPDKSVDSETIFVHTDCGTREPLDDSQQDPVWNHDGVPLDRQSYDIIAANWQAIGEASQGLVHSPPQCGANPYTMPIDDVWTASNQFYDKGDSDCCTANDGSCVNDVVVNGRAVDLCGAADGTQLCADCTVIGKYVAEMTACIDSNNNVGAIQDVAEVPGLTVQI